MKVDWILVFDPAIKRLKHGFAINAHRKFSAHSINTLSRSLKLETRILTSYTRNSNFKTRYSIFKTRYSTFKTRYSTSNTRYSTFKTWYSRLDVSIHSMGLRLAHDDVRTPTTDWRFLTCLESVVSRNPVEIIPANQCEVGPVTSRPVIQRL